MPVISLVPYKRGGSEYEGFITEPYNKVNAEIQRNVGNKFNIVKFTGYENLSATDDDGNTYSINNNSIVKNGSEVIVSGATGNTFYRLGTVLTVSQNAGSGAPMIGLDKCTSFDEAGFIKVCGIENEVSQQFAKAMPVQLSDTYNKKKGTYTYYFPVPLSSSILKAGTKTSLDVVFSSGTYDSDKKICKTSNKPAKKALSSKSTDWSWREHSSKNEIKYKGMPVEEKDYGDTDDNIPVNPYITVYRKDKFISGYGPDNPPTEIETTSTKKQNYTPSSGKISLEESSLKIYTPGEGRKVVRIFDLLGSTVYKTYYYGNNISIPLIEIRKKRTLLVQVINGNQTIATKPIRVK